MASPAIQHAIDAAGGSGKISLEWLCLSIIPDKAEGTHAGIEITSLNEYALGKQGEEMQTLKSILATLMPMVLEYRSALIELNGVFKSQGDSRATSDQRYLVSWLGLRMRDAAALASTTPSNKIARAIQAFKPTGNQTFEKELAITGYALKLFAESERTLSRCQLAIQTDPGALAYVPGYLRTRELCLQAVAIKSPGSYSLEHVPVLLRDQAMCEAALLANGMNLEFVPEHLLTVEMCARACCETGLALDLVPKSLQQAEVLFSVAISGLSEKTTGQVYEQLQETEPARAEAMFQKYAKLYNDIHYPQASDDELEELGLSLAPTP